VQNAAVYAFHAGMLISALLVAAGGLLGLVGIRNPRREVKCADCPGGQLAGQPRAVARMQWPGNGRDEASAAGVSAARLGPPGAGDRSGDQGPDGHGDAGDDPRSSGAAR